MFEIPSIEFFTRRKHLSATIGDDGIVLLAAAPAAIRNGDTHYPYRQDSNFYYLTGFSEPEAIAVIKQEQFILFSRKRDPEKERWLGKTVGQENAIQDYGATAAYSIETFGKQLPLLLKDHPQIYYPFKQHCLFAPYFNHFIENNLHTLHDLELILAEMRLIKSAAEIECIRRAAEISAHAHRNAIQACRPGLYEYQLEAVLQHTFIEQGARFTAYPAIIGSGANACILHYTDNNKLIQNQELVLIDAACEYSCYAADITRTFPSNGKFSGVQRDLYQLVLQAQLAGIAEIAPGKSWDSIQNAIIDTLILGLLELGILKGDIQALLAQKAYYPFYMHNSGHWLGLDVHDIGTYKLNNKVRLLQPGMVLTVEPGLYIDGEQAVDRKWHNLGIRIEDDILVTTSGAEILSQHVPKMLPEIEDLMAQ